jgi:hypothetical protein
MCMKQLASIHRGGARASKEGKDRPTLLPAQLVAALQDQVTAVERSHGVCVRQGSGYAQSLGRRRRATGAAGSGFPGRPARPSKFLQAFFSPVHCALKIRRSRISTVAAVGRPLLSPGRRPLTLAT